MSAALALRPDFDAADLRRLAKASTDAAQTRRLVALAVIYDASSRIKAARIGGVGLQTVRDWVLRFNARGPDGLINGQAPGSPSKLNDEQRRALARIVESGPIPAIHGVVGWRLKDLVAWIFEEFRISLDETTVGRTRRKLGFRKLSARPQAHGKLMGRTRRRWRIQKSFPAALDAIRAQLPAGTALELWWQDEARVGQKNTICRRGARRGTRPRAPRDQRTKGASIFGAICPAKGKGAGLVMPWCDSQAMSAHLKEISQAVDPGAHAVLLLDQAGWHTSPKVKVPANTTLRPLPPRSPALNAVETVWPFLRDNWLSDRVFNSYEDIVDHCCAAWDKLTDQPWLIMSIGLRDWANAWGSVQVGISCPPGRA